MFIDTFSSWGQLAGLLLTFLIPLQRHEVSLSHTHIHTCIKNKTSFYADLRSLHHLTYSIVGSRGKHCLSSGKCLQTVSSGLLFQMMYGVEKAYLMETAEF